jgi:hypothetical protein
MSATGEIEAENCRMTIQITGGTFGFKEVVQDLLDAYSQSVPYDLICVEQATVADGNVRIAGYGR